MAELLLDHYPDERETAVEHLDLAITELRDMKMAPLLEKGYFLARLASTRAPARLCPAAHRSDFLAGPARNISTRWSV